MGIVDPISHWLGSGGDCRTYFTLVGVRWELLTPFHTGWGQVGIVDPTSHCLLSMFINILSTLICYESSMYQHLCSRTDLESLYNISIPKGPLPLLLPGGVGPFKIIDPHHLVHLPPFSSLFRFGFKS